MPSSEQPLSGDHLHAWMSALNLRLYDHGPGPREMVVGGRGEERVLDRRERLVDSYARDLLVHVGGDPDRLLAVATEARRKHGERVAHGGSQRKIEAELIAIELAEHAARIVRDAGADTDPKARERLVAATEHQNLRDTGELFLGDAKVLVGDPTDLAVRLDEIDRG
ncbi:hypothetical protein [Amycolatopsis sp. NPDC051903]|uniref:hypothetical protein n=1 Tax=Amycolatopsis sp. NPDC051903 TaxID=3363936 RepID=UPI0037B0A0E5